MPSEGSTIPNLSLYGFTSLEQLATQRIITIDVPTLQVAIANALAEYTNVINEMTSQLVIRTTGYKLRYQLPSGGSLQPLDEKGNPLPVRPSGVFDIALPIKGGGTAWGDDRIVRAKMTVEDAARFTMDAMTRDTDWLRRHMLAALFTNVSYIYADPQYGDLTIMPLANGDAVVYVTAGGASVTDTHFYAQAAAISDATNPFATFYRELDEHPGNTGPYIAYVASDLVASIELLTALIPLRDPAIEYNASSRTLAVATDFDTTRRGGQMSHFGDRMIGRVNGVYIVEWSALPSGYGFVHASGTNDVLGMREYPEAELQGLFPEFNNVNGNLMEYRMIRYAGFGVMNRVGAMAFRIGNATYAIPAGLAAPLPA